MSSSCWASRCRNPTFFLPIGISFYTFQLVSYLIDVRRNEAPAYSLWSILLYISFFPHLIAGPIVRHNEIAPAICARIRCGRA